jgi:GNAT superfamily N-acetyltransferase
MILDSIFLADETTRVSATSSHEITYRTTRDLPRDSVLVLYGACRWSSAEKPDELMAALAGSHTVISAWDGDRLVGLGNAITDGALVVYYPHLLVHPDYQHRGIGRQIMRQLMERYAGYHQHAVLADDNAINFYRSCGFTRPANVRAMWVYSATDHGPTERWASQAEQFFWRLLREQNRPFRQNVALGSWAAQLLAVIVVAIASFETESILTVWPALAVLGYTHAAITWPLRSWRTLMFGLSAPILTAVGALLLALIHDKLVSQYAAVLFLMVLIVGYAGLYAARRARPVLREILAWQLPECSHHKAWQFSLKSLLVATSVLAVLSATVGAIARYTNGDTVSIWLAVYAAANLALCSFAIERLWSGKQTA